MQSSKKLLVLFSVLLLTTSYIYFQNRSLKEDVHRADGKTDNVQSHDTSNKVIYSEQKKTFSFKDISFSNNFKGSKLSQIKQLEDGLFEIKLEAENYPINDSPWYAFKVWKHLSNPQDAIRIKLVYQNWKKTIWVRIVTTLKLAVMEKIGQD